MVVREQFGCWEYLGTKETRITISSHKIAYIWYLENPGWYWAQHGDVFDWYKWAWQVGESGGGNGVGVG